MLRARVQASFLLLLTLLAAGLVASCQPELHSLIGRPCDPEHSCVDEELVCCQGTCQLASEVPSCGGPGPGDGGSSDGGEDGGTGGGADGGPDAGVPADGGTSDGGNNPPGPDAGTPDAGSPQDAGCPPNLLIEGGAEPPLDINDYFDGTGRGRIDPTSTTVRSGTGAIKMTRTSTSAGTYGVELKEAQFTGAPVGVVYCVSAWFRRGTTRGRITLTTRHFNSSGGSANIISDYTEPLDDGWHNVTVAAGLSQEFNRTFTFFTSVDTSAGSEYYVDDIRVWRSPSLPCDRACAY
ncbi:hypothetical protein [Hyalangium gracile]|uniref:hypothetical protein n=1 Tax=Hyalangium gracile TaxID=394092 RepID=UPI001CCA2756|nr:hypothetical protein [Hyalangium gracile]